MTGNVGEVANVGIVEIGDFFGTRRSQGHSIALFIDRREVTCHGWGWKLIFRIERSRRDIEVLREGAGVEGKEKGLFCREKG